MINSKRSMISPFQLFFILTVSRISVALTYIQAVSVGKMAFDIAVSLFASMILTLLLSLPVYFCVKNGRSPLNVRWSALLYGIYFSYFCAVNVSRFAYFTVSHLDERISMPVICAVIILLAAYCAKLGIEGISRFASFCAAILLIAVCSAVILNADKFEAINLYPLYRNESSTIIKNIFVFTANSIESAVFICLSDKVNGKKVPAAAGALAVSFSVIIMLVIMCVGVSGYGASLQSFPIFTLFQLSSIGSLARLDMIHTCFWALAIMIKASMLIYCAADAFTFSTKNKSCTIWGLVSIVISVIITLVFGMKMVEITKIISIICFALFVVLMPLFSLVLVKGDKNAFKIN